MFFVFNLLTLNQERVFIRKLFKRLADYYGYYFKKNKQYFFDTLDKLLLNKGYSNYFYVDELYMYTLESNKNSELNKNSEPDLDKQNDDKILNDNNQSNKIDDNQLNKIDEIYKYLNRKTVRSLYKKFNSNILFDYIEDYVNKKKKQYNIENKNIEVIILDNACKNLKQIDIPIRKDYNKYMFGQIYKCIDDFLKKPKYQSKKIKKIGSVKPINDIDSFLKKMQFDDDEIKLYKKYVNEIENKIENIMK